ncbi:MAG: 4-hydroxy-tetrahydrodipicolinate synthase [Clostridia bacterium]|nr:4-hydroxy-tetrahydrodipicolinate synthase [Clostridia bacterium]
MKKIAIFSGTATALVTPLRSGAIDFIALDRLIERQLQASIDALVIGGTTGEAATLTDGERYELFRHVKDTVRGRCKLLYGTGTNDTAVAVRHTRMAASLGCDGVLCVTPYYNKGTEEGLIRHYLSIADSADVPILLYNVPSRTGVHLNERQLKTLADCERIVGIKEAADSADRLVMLASFGDELHLYAGNDSQIYTTLALGGRGVISVVSNVLPVATGHICRAFFEGHREESLSAQLHLLPLIRSLFLETNPTPVKAMLSMMGLCTPDVRLPLTVPTEATMQVLQRTLQDYTNEE